MSGVNSEFEHGSGEIKKGETIMSAKTNKERIEDMDEKIKALQAQKQKLIAQEIEK